MENVPKRWIPRKGSKRYDAIPETWESRRKWQNRYRERELRGERKAKGLCYRCGKPREPDATSAQCNACAEKIRIYAKRWHQTNPEKAKEVMKRYTKKWRRENKERLIQYQINRQRRTRAAEGECSPKQLQARIDYYGGLCYICSKPYEEIDHVIPVSNNGTNWPANLRPICQSHNRQKRDRTLQDFLAEIFSG